MCEGVCECVCVCACVCVIPLTCIYEEFPILAVCKQPIHFVLRATSGGQVNVNEL